jgi:hypothetical protein
MDPLMSLVVGWTLVGAFVFTVIITCLSLVGWVQFADKKQQRALFTAVIIELVLVFGAQLVGVARYQPEPVRKSLKAEGGLEAVGQLLTPAPGVPPVTKSQLQGIVDRIEVEPTPAQSGWKRELTTQIQALPAGAVSPESAQRINRQLRNKQFAR